MAVRPVFVPKKTSPYFSIVNIDFEWNGGFAVSQKRKNINAMHEGYKRIFPGGKPLEISSKSENFTGVSLSAFNLKKFVPVLNKSVPVENVYQAGKIFQGGNNYPDLLEVSPIDAKRDKRIKEGGKIIGFTFDGCSFPTVPESLFYNFIYMNAILENEWLAEEIMKYSCFTDIEFNPAKSISTQAKSAAVFVALCQLGFIDKIKNPEEFRKLF